MKVGRNEPCPCGSGKKYKKCCLVRAEERRAEAMVEERPERQETMESLARKLESGPEPAAAPDRTILGHRDEDEVQNDFREANPEEAWWEEFDDEFQEAETVADLCDLAVLALREAPTFSGDDGAEFVIRIEALVETVKDGRALLDVMEAWKKHRPETYSSETVWLAPTRVALVLRYGLGDLEDAVMTAARDAARNVDRFEPLILGPLAWWGETGLLVRAVTAAWPSYLAGEGGFMGGVVENLAFLGIEANMAAECEGLAVDDTATEVLGAMSARIVGEEEADEFLRVHRRQRGLLTAAAEPVSDALADLTLAPALATLWKAMEKLRKEHAWPAPRTELAASLWVQLLGKTERLHAKTERGISADHEWSLLLPEGKRLQDWWHRQGGAFFPNYFEPAAWIASLGVWIDLYLTDAPVPAMAAQQLAEAVGQVCDDIIDQLNVPEQDLALIREGVRRCAEWARTCCEQRSAKLPGYLEDGDIRALLTAGDSMDPALWHRMLDRGPEILPLLHSLLDDFHLADLDDEPIPGASRYYAAIHGAFIAAAIGGDSSVPHIIGLADRADDDEWLHEGLAWFPTAFGPDSVEAFLDFVRNGRVRWYQRAAAAKGVVWAAGQHPELRDRVVAGLVEALDGETSNADAVTALIRPAVATGDQRALEAVRRAYQRDMVDEGFCGDLEDALSVDEAWFLQRPPVHLTAEAYFAARSGRRSGRSNGGRPRPTPRKQRKAAKTGGKKKRKRRKKRK